MSDWLGDWLLQFVSGYAGQAQNGGTQSNDPSADPADYNQFVENRDNIADAMSNDGDIVVTGIRNISGTTFTITLSFSDIANRLSNYQFYFNNSASNSTGLGASFSNYAIIDPLYLQRYDPDDTITVQGERPTPDAYATWNWVTLHELAHQFLIDAGIYGALYQQWSTRVWTQDQSYSLNPFENSPEWAENEGLASALANTILQRIGLNGRNDIGPNLSTNPFIVSR